MPLGSVGRCRPKSRRTTTTARPVERCGATNSIRKSDQRSPVFRIRRVLAKQVIKFLRTTQGIRRADDHVTVGGIHVDEVSDPTPSVHATIATEIAGSGAVTFVWIIVSKKMQIPIFRKLFWQAARRADSRANRTAGTRRATKIAMMEITTKSSIRVKPLRVRRSIDISFLNLSI